jgi:carbon monoxide dehydrogenase subunit G
MEMTESREIGAPRAVVWAGLNDPEILRQCIPGCESLEKLSDTEMQAKVTLKIGPVKATFKGAVTLKDLDPPNAYTISGEGTGGAAGHAKGSAFVQLEENEAGTTLNYAVKVQIGGKLAQLGGRLIDATAKKLAGEFFTKFSELVAPVPQPETEEAPASPQKQGWLGGVFSKKDQPVP